MSGLGYSQSAPTGCPRQLWYSLEIKHFFQSLYPAFLIFISPAERKVQRLEAEVRELEVENQSLQVTLEELRLSARRLEQLEAEKQSLEQEVTALERDKRRLEKDNRRLKQQVGFFEDEKAKNVCPSGLKPLPCCAVKD